MEIIVTFGFAYLSLFESFQALPAATCSGINGISCCTGFKWNLTQKKCLPCQKGYIGPNCDIKCIFPSYGFHCQMNCSCIAEYCDPVNGCKRSTTGLDWDSKMVTTDLLESEDNVAKICKKGYNGTNCEERCPYPSYGLGCQKQCNCIDKHCDHVSGCMQSAKDHPTSIDFQHNTATVEYMESEYNIINYNSDYIPPNDKTTTSCAKGFYGTNCDIKCPYPAFGQACQSVCVCSVGYCDHANGCTQPPGIYKIYSTLHLDYQATTTELPNTVTEIKITTNARMKNGTNKNSMDVVPNKNESKRISSLKVALIGQTVVFLFTLMIYLYTKMLEKRQIDINKD